jgi:flagellar assembly protein FliH
MKQGVTSPVGSSAGSTSSVPVRREGGAVLRDVALHHEPRVLPAPGQPPRGRPTPRPAEPAPAGDGLLPAAPETGPGTELYQARAEEASAYQRGWEAGRAELQREGAAAQAEAARQAELAGFERGLREGREKGLAEGRAAGREQVERDVQEAREGMADRLARLDRLLGALPAELSRRLATAEEEMIALSHEVVCRLLGDQAATREGVARLVTQAVRQAGEGGLLDGSERSALAVHLHPADLDAVRADAGLVAWLERSRQGQVRWVSDDRVALGGCLVRSGEGTLDARLETQLAALHRILREYRQRAGEAGAVAGPAEASAPPPGGEA